MVPEARVDGEDVGLRCIDNVYPLAPVTFIVAVVVAETATPGLSPGKATVEVLSVSVMVSEEPGVKGEPAGVTPVE